MHSLRIYLFIYIKSLVFLYHYINYNIIRTIQLIHNILEIIFARLI